MTVLPSLAHPSQESEKAEKMQEEWTEPVEASPLDGDAEGEWTLVMKCTIEGYGPSMG